MMWRYSRRISRTCYTAEDWRKGKTYLLNSPICYGTVHPCDHSTNQSATEI